MKDLLKIADNVSLFDGSMVRAKLGVETALAQFVTSFREAEESGLILLWPAADMILPEASSEMK